MQKLMQIRMTGKLYVNVFVKTCKISLASWFMFEGFNYKNFQSNEPLLWQGIGKTSGM